jgi:hypothetical protein
MCSLPGIGLSSQLTMETKEKKISSILCGDLWFLLSENALFQRSKSKG